MSNSRLLRISSKDRSVESKSRYNIDYRTNDNDLHSVKSVILKSVIIPNTQYNINTNNNTFRFVNSVTAADEFTVPEGQYNITTLISVLESFVTGLSITQNAVTQKLTFALSGGTFNIETTNLMSKVLGFETTGTGLSTYTSDNMANLRGLEHVYILSQVLSSNSGMISNDKEKQNIFCDIPCRSAFGQNIVMDEDNNSLDFITFHNHKNISSINVKLIDQNSNEIDLNGSDWTLIFRVYM
jgi:hypothetical protein